VQELGYPVRRTLDDPGPLARLASRRSVPRLLGPRRLNNSARSAESPHFGTGDPSPAVEDKKATTAPLHEGHRMHPASSSPSDVDVRYRALVDVASALTSH
jgi:hypothetical protein